MDKEAQVQALLTGKAYQYAVAKLKVGHMVRHSYAEVFSVTRNDIDAYIAKHGIPMDLVSTTEDFGEGLCFVEEGDSWVIFWQERGQRFHEQTFHDECAAKAALVDRLLALSGTDLYTKR